MAKTPVKTNRKKTLPVGSGATAVVAAPPAAKKPRRLKKPQYKAFRFHKHIKSEGSTIPGAFRLFRSAIGVLLRNWKIFLAVSLIYGVLNFVLVQGFSVTGLGDTKASLEQVAQGNWSWFTNGASLYAYMLSSADGGSNPGAGVYQAITQIVVSLAIIWTLRQIYAGKKVGIRDGFYQGVYPLVPFMLVLVTTVLQALPAVVGVYLYSTVNNNGIAATTAEQVLWALVAFLAVLLSLYWMCSSIVGLYVVSLPNMKPVAALRSASQLVQFRRWAVLRKALLLPVVLLLVGGAILIPVIILWTPAAPWVFLVLAMFVLPITHSYYYALYRSLL